MHDAKWIVENTDEFDQAMTKRGLPPLAKAIIEMYEEKKQLVTIIQKLNHLDHRSNNNYNLN